MGTGDAYRRVVVEAEAAREDAVAQALWAAGSRGSVVVPGEGGRVRLASYFAVETDGAAIEAAVAAAGAALVSVDDEPARDWLAAYRAAAVPFEVGEAWRLDPRDPDAAGPGPGGGTRDPDGRLRLHLPAQTAFGTGSHESTRLVLRWLERMELAGRDVLDVGCGSGILAFAAGHRGARRVLGFDLDAQAVLIAAKNARLNRARPRLAAASIAAVAPAAAWDVVLVNVLPEHVRPHLPAIAARLRPGGRLISSGNLRRQSREMLARWAGVGLRGDGALEEGEWVALRLRKEAP